MLHWLSRRMVKVSSDSLPLLRGRNGCRLKAWVLVSGEKLEEAERHAWKFCEALMVNGDVKVRRGIPHLTYGTAIYGFGGYMMVSSGDGGRRKNGVTI